MFTVIISKNFKHTISLLNGIFTCNRIQNIYVIQGVELPNIVLQVWWIVSKHGKNFTAK